MGFLSGVLSAGGIVSQKILAAANWGAELSTGRSLEKLIVEFLSKWVVLEGSNIISLNPLMIQGDGVQLSTETEELIKSTCGLTIKGSMRSLKVKIKLGEVLGTTSSLPDVRDCLSRTTIYFDADENERDQLLTLRLGSLVARAPGFELEILGLELELLFDEVWALVEDPSAIVALIDQLMALAPAAAPPVPGFVLDAAGSLLAGFCELTVDLEDISIKFDGSMRQTGLFRTDLGVHVGSLNLDTSSDADFVLAHSEAPPGEEGSGLHILEQRLASLPLRVAVRSASIELGSFGKSAFRVDLTCCAVKLKHVGWSKVLLEVDLDSFQLAAASEVLVGPLHNIRSPEESTQPLIAIVFCTTGTCPEMHVHIGSLKILLHPSRWIRGLALLNLQRVEHRVAQVLQEQKRITQVIEIPSGSPVAVTPPEPPQVTHEKLELAFSLTATIQAPLILITEKDHSLRMSFDSIQISSSSLTRVDVKLTTEGGPCALVSLCAPTLAHGQPVPVVTVQEPNINPPAVLGVIDLSIELLHSNLDGPLIQIGVVAPGIVAAVNRDHVPQIFSLVDSLREPFGSTEEAVVAGLSLLLVKALEMMQFDASAYHLPCIDLKANLPVQASLRHETIQATIAIHPGTQVTTCEDGALAVLCTAIDVELTQGAMDFLALAVAAIEGKVARSAVVEFEAAVAGREYKISIPDPAVPKPVDSRPALVLTLHTGSQTRIVVAMDFLRAFTGTLDFRMQEMTIAVSSKLVPAQAIAHHLSKMFQSVFEESGQESAFGIALAISTRKLMVGVTPTPEEGNRPRQPWLLYVSDGSQPFLQHFFADSKGLQLDLTRGCYVHIVWSIFSIRDHFQLISSMITYAFPEDKLVAAGIGEMNLDITNILPTFGLFNRTFVITTPQSRFEGGLVPKSCKLCFWFVFLALWFMLSFDMLAALQGAVNVFLFIVTSNSISASSSDTALLVVLSTLVVLRVLMFPLLCQSTFGIWYRFPAAWTGVVLWIALAVIVQVTVSDFSDAGQAASQLGFSFLTLMNVVTLGIWAYSSCIRHTDGNSLAHWQLPPSSIQIEICLSIYTGLNLLAGSVALGFVVSSHSLLLHVALIVRNGFRIVFGFWDLGIKAHRYWNTRKLHEAADVETQAPAGTVNMENVKKVPPELPPWSIDEFVLLLRSFMKMTGRLFWTALMVDFVLCALIAVATWDHQTQGDEVSGFFDLTAEDDVQFRFVQRISVIEFVVYIFMAAGFIFLLFNDLTFHRRLAMRNALVAYGSLGAHSTGVLTAVRATVRWNSQDRAENEPMADSTALAIGLSGPAPRA